MSHIYLAGEGHGAIALVKGILNETNLIPSIIVITHDKELIEICKKHTIKIKTNIPFRNLKREDIVITSGYNQIIKSNYVDKAKFLNIHYSLLPKYRGMHTVVWALINGEEEVGYTIHEVTEQVDAGPIYFQKSIKVESFNSWELMLKLDKLVQKDISQFLKLYLSGSINSQVQDEREAICVGKRNKDDCKVNWNEWDSKYFPLYMKALVNPYPRPFFIYKNKNYELLDLKIRSIKYREINGHVVHICDRYVGVKISDGIAYFEYFLSEGKKIKSNKVIKKLGVRL